jgi:hypothetical protein
MLALTHHLIVQYCAYLAHRKIYLFKDYIVLGDDIVIADKAVADCYHHVMVTNLQVSINMAKGLMSPIGLEFAKRFYINNIDHSPLSLKEFTSIGSTYSSFTGLLGKFNLTSSKVLRLFGRGSKSCGHSHTRLAVLCKLLVTSLNLYKKSNPLTFIQHFVPSFTEFKLKSFIINRIIDENKLKALFDLEKDGPDSTYFKREELVKIPQIALSSRLQKTSFGDSALYTQVKRGLTPDSISRINDMLLFIDSPVNPAYYLQNMAMDKVLDIYFIDIKTLSAENSQSPLLKPKAKGSILRN